MSDDAASLRVLSERCRRLAKGVGSRDVSDALSNMADEYDRQVVALEAGREGPPSTPDGLP